jgi:hypothetical protein
MANAQHTSRAFTYGYAYAGSWRFIQALGRLSA